MDTIQLFEDHLLWQYDDHLLRIEAWGENSLRVRATKAAQIDTSQAWALLPPGTSSRSTIGPAVDRLWIWNGRDLYR